MALILRDEIIGGHDGGDFDEEAQEREEYQIEEMLEEFVDEAPIRHDVYPESEDEQQERAVREKRRTHIRRGDGALYANQTFYNGVAFKEAVIDYALKTGRNLKQYRYDKNKIGFKCVGVGNEEGESCKWKIYASSLPNDVMWKVRVFKDVHSCTVNGECELIKVPVIARLFLDKLREEPDLYMPQKIEEWIKKEYAIVASRPQCQSARNKALRWIEKEYDTQFERLRDYAAEIVYANENATVEVATVTNAEGQDVFSRFYVCFEQLRRTWRESCRPLIGVDGCFVKGKIKGQLLVAIGRDASNAIYPVAWGVVQVENTENWLWFVRKLKVDLGLGDGDGFIIMSDRQKGLIRAVELELPNIEHRMCVRHIYANLKKRHGDKKQMKPYVWNLAWSYSEAEYEERLERIRCYDTGVYDDVMKTKPKTWCRAFYKLGTFCEDVENNSTESFNSSINKAREKAFIPMLEAIRRQAMARIAKRSAISHDHTGICTPFVARFLKDELKRASECKVTRSINGFYEACLSGCSYRVNLEQRTCSCRKFDITGIPCEHAYGVILVKKLVPEDFVCHWFRTFTWKRNYTDGIVPLRGARYWPSTEGMNVHVPPDPLQPGRKKMSKADKKRKRGVNESPSKKKTKEKKRIMHCGICGRADHNSRFHLPKKTKASQAGTSQDEASQASLTQAEASQASLTQAEASQACPTQI